MDGNTENRLKQLAQAEAAAVKERLTKRTAAARDYGVAVARLAEAAVTWERIQGEVTMARAKAVADLLDSEMAAADVAKLLGLETKELRALRGAAPPETAAQFNAPEQRAEQDHAA